MPDIGPLHPQIVHFVVVGGMLGLPLYWLAFFPKLRALRLTAAILLLVATVAAWAAVASGMQASGLVEHLPGVAGALRAHRVLAEDTRDIFTGMLLLELVALGLAWKSAGPGRTLMEIELGEPHPPRPSPIGFVAMIARVVVGITWAFAAIILFVTAQRGGALVYDYAGGVGVRRGRATDVEHLLIAGLYGQARVDRERGDHRDAARLVHEMLRLEPDSASVRLLWVQSLLEDGKDGRAALAALDSVSTRDPRLRVREAAERAAAYRLLGKPDSAAAALDALPASLRSSRALGREMQELNGGGS